MEINSAHIPPLAALDQAAAFAPTPRVPVKPVETTPKPEKAKQEGLPQYRAPVGESGGTPNGVRVSNSQIRIHDFERRHLAFHKTRTQLAGEDFELVGQHTRIKTALTEDHKVVAVGGSAESTLKTPDGREVLLRELAYLSDLRKTLLAPGAASSFFGDSKKAIPNLALMGNLGSRVRVQDDRNAIRDFARLQLTPQPTGKSPNLIGAQQDNVAAFRHVLEGLNQRISNLQTALTEDFRTVSSSNAFIVKAQVRGAPETASHAVQVDNEAKKLTVASSKQFPKLGQALGISGRFYINDTAIDIVATDDIEDVARKINFGEDLNRNGFLDNTEDKNFNGVLDTGEDLNENGLLDTHEDANQNGVLDAGEDLNFNLSLDATEDVNFNNQIDGGTANHNVEARIVDFRLQLQLTLEGDQEISIVDEYNVLDQLGLVDQTVFRNPAFENVTAVGEDAVFTLNGEEITQNSNAIDSVSGLSLNILGEGQSQVDISVRTATQTLVEAFSGLFNQFNSVVTELNETQKESGLFADQAAIKRFRIKAVNDAQTRLADTQGGIKSIRDLGAELQNTSKLTHSQLGIAGLRSRFEEGTATSFDKAAGIGTFARNLDRVGILTQTDDTVTLDAAKLAQALEEDFEGVTEFLLDDEVGVLAALGKTVSAGLDGGGEVGILEQRLGDSELQQKQANLVKIQNQQFPGIDALLDVIA